MFRKFSSRKKVMDMGFLSGPPDSFQTTVIFIRMSKNKGCANNAIVNTSSLDASDRCKGLGIIYFM